MWAWIKNLFGAGGSAVSGAALGGIPQAISASAGMAKAVTDAIRENNRVRTDEAIRKEFEGNEQKINEALDAVAAHRADGVQ